MTSLSEIRLSDTQRLLRMNIRNAYLAEDVTTLRLEANNRGAQGKWFEVAVLLELASED